MTFVVLKENHIWINFGLDSPKAKLLKLPSKHYLKSSATPNLAKTSDETMKRHNINITYFVGLSSWHCRGLWYQVTAIFSGLLAFLLTLTF